MGRMARGEDPINVRTVGNMLANRVLGEVVGTLLGVALIALARRVHNGRI